MRAPRIARETVAHPLRVPAVLHDQRGLGVGGEAHHGAHRRRAVGGVEERPVHQLDRRGARLQEADHRLERGVDRREGHDGEAARGRPLHQAQLGAPRHRERALRPAEQPRPVGGVAAERLEGVAGDAPHQVRWPGLRGEGPGALERGRSRRAATQRRARPVGERHLERQDVVGREAVDHRAGAGGVVGDHPPERRPARGRHVGAEGEPVRGGRAVQVVEHHARAHPGDARVGVDLDLPEGRAVDHQPAPDRLAREARPAAAHGQRDAGLPAGLHGGVQIAGVVRPGGSPPGAAGRCSRRSRRAPARPRRRAPRRPRSGAGAATSSGDLIAGCYGLRGCVPHLPNDRRDVPCGPGGLC